MFLNFTATLNFVGTNPPIETPIGCGDLAENRGPMQKTVESDRDLGIIDCFVNRSTSEIRIHVNETVEGVVGASAVR